MKLFTVGPVQMYDNTLKVASEQIPYFRTMEFSKIVLNIEEKIKKMVFTDISSKVALLTASGTGAMDSVICNCLDENDKVLIINGGTFGNRFCELCKIYKIAYDEINLKFEEKLSQKHFEKLDGTQYTALLVNIHETSVGQLYDINIIKNFCKKNNIFLIVDAISSFCSDIYKMDENNIDCTIISSQKGLALNPGMSIVVLSDRLYNQKVKNKPIKNMYLDLNLHIENIKRGQTPFTPAVEILLELNERLNYIDQYGIENVIANTEKIAKYFREKIVSSKYKNIRILEYNLSNTLTPIYFSDGNAKIIFNKLKDLYGIYVTPSGGKLENNLLRIGHLGNLKEKDYDELIEKIGVILDK